MKIRSHSLILGVALCFSQSLSAAAIALIDFQATNGVDATLTDFTTAGVAEDITGGSIDVFEAGVNGTLTGGTGNVTVAFTSTTPQAYTWGPSGTNSVVYDGAYLTSGKGPSTVTVSNITIAAGTTYKLYIWGAATSAGQEGSFTFDGSTIVAGSPTRATPAVFTFDSTTTGVTGSSVAFQFARTGSNSFGVINGIAITAVPEPSAYGAIAGFLALGWVMLRRRK